MKKITDFIVKHRLAFLFVFIFISLFSLYISIKVNINDDIMKYLPKNSETKIGKDIMDKEFKELDSTSINVMFKNLSKKEKAETLEKLENIKGVSSVLYENNKNYNKGKHTLYVLNVDDYTKSKTSEKIYNTLNKDFKVEAMSGPIYDEYHPVLQMWIVALSIGCALLLLILLSESFTEPFLYLISIGIAVFINKGTNIMFSSVSNITDSIVAVLQLALSMDYSIMLSNRFKQEKRKTDNKVEAMKNALYNSFKAISSSSLTTIVGLLALIFMSFTIGKDLGFVLAKGVLLSLISIFCCLPALLLIFDNLIEKTKKKSLKFNLTKLGQYSHFTRYVQLLLVPVLFIIAYFIKGNVNILYTSSEQDEVGKVFSANNQMAIVYNNKYEDIISKYCKEIEKDKNVDQALCYANTISDPLLYNELNGKFKELGQDVVIDENILKIIYTSYFNKTDIKMSPNDFVDFIKNDILSNFMFKSKISSDSVKSIELLSEFTDVEKLNKQKSLDELSSLLNISKNDLEKIYVLYESKNNNSKMAINSFINFLLNDVSKDSNYSSYISSDMKKKLTELSVFTNSSYIKSDMNSAEISKLFGIDKSLVDQLFLLYAVNSDSSTKLSLNNFASFSLNLSSNDSYKDMFNDEMKTKLSLLKNLSDANKVNAKLNQTEMKNSLASFGINVTDDLVETLYVIYNGSLENHKMSLGEFVNVTLNMAQSEKYSSYFSNDKVEELQAVLSLIDNGSTSMPSANLYNMFGIDEINQSKINYAITQDTNGSFNMTPIEFVNLLLNTDAIKEGLNNNVIEQLNTSLYIMNHGNDKLNQSEVSKALSIDKSICNLVFGVHRSITNNLDNISIKEIINFIYQNKDNVMLKNYISNFIDKILFANKIINSIDSEFTYKELSEIISIDESSAKKIYGLYDGLNKEIKISPYNLVNFILNNQTNPLLSGKISKDKLTLLKTLSTVMDSVLNNKKYSSSELSKMFSIDKNKLDIIYSLYNYKTNKTGAKISLNKLILFIKNDVITSDEYKDNFTSDKKEKITSISNIINASINGEKLTSKELYNNLSKLSDSLDKSLVDLVYILFETKYNYNDEWKITIEDLVSYLSNDVINDKKYSSFINDSMKTKITNADKVINKSKNLLVSDKYSRMILNTSYKFEDKDTYNFVNKIKSDLKDLDDIYVVGNSPMAVEMNKTFNSELNRITILTMIFIFLVVAFTFKDLIIPFILVLIIQTAVYITMSAISITGGNVYFISLIIVQAILMGATIDYAIVYTSYYRESREKHDCKTSIIKAYNKSIHTIISSSSILIIVTLIVSNFADAISAKICETISQGAIAATILVLFVLPGTLAAADKLICRGSKYKK